MTTKLNLPFIRLPLDYTRMLMANHNATGDFFERTVREIFANPSLKGLLHNFYTSTSVKIPFEAQVKSLGWLGLRDFYATVYLEQKLFGRFAGPSEEAKNLLQDLLSFERMARELAVDGHSRLFLLGFYLQMVSLHTNKGMALKGSKDFRFGLLPIECINTLIQNSGRTVRTDWLILIATHFYQFLGGEKFLNLVKSGQSFKKSWSLLDNNHRKELAQNLMRYAASVGDTELLSQTVVGAKVRSEGSEQPSS